MFKNEYFYDENTIRLFFSSNFIEQSFIRLMKLCITKFSNKYYTLPLKSITSSVFNNSKKLSYSGIPNKNGYVYIKSINQSYYSLGIILRPIMKEYEKKQFKYDFFQSYLYNNQIKNGNNQDFLKENINSSKAYIDKIRQQQLEQSDKTTECDKEKKHNLINDEQMLIPEDKTF